MDIIEFKDLRFIKEEHRNPTLVAKIIINGYLCCEERFCDLYTFLDHTHIEDIKSYYISKLPKLNEFDMWYRSKPKDFFLTEEQKEILPFNEYFRKKKIKKLITKNKSKRVLNLKFQEERVYRNNFYLNYKKRSSVYLDTCDCGVPGCAGIDNGVFIKETKNTVEYSIIPSKRSYLNGILNTNKNKLIFSRTNIEMIRKELKEMIKNKHEFKC